MADIFISYQRSDIDSVKKIVNHLQDDGLSVWFDSDLKAGNSIGFNSEIELAINGAKIVLVCWSKKSTESVFVKAEALRALELEKLFPIYLEPTQLPVPFNALHTPDLIKWEEDISYIKWSKFLKLLKSKLANTLPVSTLSSGSYLDIIKRLTNLIPEGETDNSSAVALNTFHNNRWEITSLLFAIDALTPRIPTSSEKYWNQIFNSGHFVPEEITGHHAIQSLTEVNLLAQRISIAAQNSLKVLLQADASGSNIAQ